MAPTNDYDRAWTECYYNELAEGEWNRFQADAAGRVNLYVHTHYVRTYVRPESRVLEIGAGPGRFTQILAELECRVTVADLSNVQLDLHREHAEELGFEHTVESRHLTDVCDLTEFETDSFDAVLCYGGPLSYVFDRAPEAMAECTRVCKPGGKVLASVMSLWGSCHRYLDGVLQIPAEANQRITGTGDLTPANWSGVNHRCHMFRSGELRELATNAGLQVAALSASNCLALTWDEHLQQYGEDSPEWRELLRMELEACSQDGCLDMGTHMIVVGTK
jgi:2-polyprenyl-3-methyl-5-hydroxy-6-metoxy-1,4-benzoquinol methylase